MDHATADLIEFNTVTLQTKMIDSKFTHEVKEDALKKGEYLMHNKEQHLQAEYYKKLGEVIKNYDEVLLFGPTTAKEELLNSLKNDHLFSKIHIEAKNTDKMTEPEQHTFVKNYFAKH